MSYYDIPSLYVPIKWRRHPDLNRSITVLQTAALPLGYAAIITGAGERVRTVDVHLGKVALYR